MNILVYNYRTKEEHIGGVETYVHEYTQRLAKLGHEVHFISFTTRKVSYELARDCVLTHYISDTTAIPIYKHFARLYKLHRLLKRLLKRYDFHVTNIHGSGGLDLLYRKKLKKRLPLVYFFHASYPLELRFDFTRHMRLERSPGKRGLIMLQYLFNSLRFKYSEGRALRLSQRIITDSLFDQRQIIGAYGAHFEKKLTVIPIGIDTEKFYPAENKTDIRDKLGLPHDQTLFLCIRNLRQRMGLLNLIEAARLVIEQYNRQDFIVLIGGTGELQDQLENLITKYNLSTNITLLGFIEENQLVEHYQAADAFILPSEDLEGFGIVTLEALACDVPVIGTPVGATPEILAPLNQQLLTRDTTAHAIAEKMAFFLTHKGQFNVPNSYRRYVEKNYSWDKTVKRIEKVFAECKSAGMESSR